LAPQWLPDIRGVYQKERGRVHNKSRFQPARPISMTRQGNWDKTYFSVPRPSLSQPVTVTGRQSNQSMSPLRETAAHETRAMT